MKFYEGKEDTTIKEYTKEGTWYEIVYLNNESDYYPNEDPNHELEIQERILKQAIEREEELLKKYNKDEIISTILFLISLPTAYISMTKAPMIIFLVSSIVAFLSGKKLIKTRKRLKDIKKYRMYLDIKEDLEKKENSDIYDIIEFDKFLQVKLDLTTIDKYRYSDVKALKKEINRRNNL